MSHGTILVVEDDAAIRETLKDVLEMEGFQVLTAEHGEDALQLLQRVQPPCLILLDLMMPVMDGWEFLEAMSRASGRRVIRVPVAVVSAAAELTEVQRRFRCEVLRKPVDIDSLVDMARRHCETAG